MTLEDMEAIIKMTDEQAAELLEKVLEWNGSSRATGKTVFNLQMRVALTKAVKALRERGGEKNDT